MTLARNNTLLRNAYSRVSDVLSDGPGLRLSREEGHYKGHAWWQITPPRPDHDLGARGDPGTRVLVASYDQFTLRTIERLDYLTPQSLRNMGEPAVLVVAPWLSPRVRKVIAERNWNYLDLTGNLLLRVQRPIAYLRATGADSDPRPPGERSFSLRGSTINGLVRVLVEAVPPFRAKDLATAAGVSESFVSRALHGIEELGLLDRAGPVVRVDWVELLRERSAHYRLCEDNRGRAFQVKDANDLLTSLRGEEVVVTGPAAADLIGPLVLYVPDVKAFARMHGLEPARTGGNVTVLRPAAPSQIERCRVVNGVRRVGYSQLAQDLLSGGQPDAGEEVLLRMREDLGWRVPLKTLICPRGWRD